MNQVVLASNNAHKVEEMAAMLAPLHIKLISQSDYHVPSANETGLTFIENAIIKARHACELTGLPAISDDSGLAVDALGGAPGIYSARYAGEEGNHNKNMAKLLEALADVPEIERTAHFHCVIVYMQHTNDPTPVVCHGKWSGRITEERQGAHGFGYDPVFWVPSHNCTSAELPPETKNAISHRAIAIEALKKSFKTSHN